MTSLHIAGTAVSSNACLTQRMHCVRNQGERMPFFSLFGLIQTFTISRSPKLNKNRPIS